MNLTKKILGIICCVAFSAWAVKASVMADSCMEYGLELRANASHGDFAPYFIGSNNFGLTPSRQGMLTIGRIRRTMTHNGRWDFGFGAEISAGHTSGRRYARYHSDDDMWGSVYVSPTGDVTLRELYGEVRFKSLALTVGLKKYGSAIANDDIASGDFTHSNNARPVPQVRIGLVDFRDIPFTKGALQIQATLAYGKFTDNKYVREQYNHYNYHINQGSLYNYKRVYFRTKPSEPLSVIFGMQSASQFGGVTSFYYYGEKLYDMKLSKSLRSFLEVTVPFLGNGKEGFYTGNSLGSWDLKARYRLPGGDKLYAYFEWPWEDGSGIGRRNGWDGIWGVEWKAADEGTLISGAVVEYIDFRNQSGPIHWAPGDYPGSTITESCTGGDDYYNNSMYNSYANYGMSMGSPLMLSPYYNLDGYPAYLHTRTRGVHAGVKGCLGSKVDYRVKFSWQQAWGSGRLPRANALYNTSWMAEGSYDASSLVKGLRITGAIAMDRGALRGNNFGAMISFTYSGILNKSK